MVNRNTIEKQEMYMYTDINSLLMVNLKVDDIRILWNLFKTDHADLEWT